MKQNVLGLHHVTAITSNGQKNYDFYTKVLGLRLVKRTVNYDDPTSYHLYYADYAASLGSLLTFFVWPEGQAGRQGLPQAMEISFSIPEEAMGFWIHRLTHFGIAYERNKEKKFSDNYLSFKDPDGLILELVADAASPASTGQAHPEIEETNAIRGFHSITLWENGFDATDKFLREVLGYERLLETENRFRYRIQNEGRGSFIDLRSAPDFWAGKIGASTIHHIAFRTPTEETQIEWQEWLTQQGNNVSPVMDREYFKSIYFPEPGGVLFEIATDGPGMTINESLETLGQKLQIPTWYEKNRKDIEDALPIIHF